MEAAIVAVVQWFIAQGASGILNLLTATALYFMYRDNGKLRVEVSGLQEKRVGEARESMSAINSSAMSLNNHSQLLTSLMTEIRASRDFGRRSR